MSDDFDLDKLADALKAAPPSPDGERKAENITASLKNFESRQGMAAGLRPTFETTHKGAFFKGVAYMFDTLTSRAAMATTTAIVAVGFTFYVVYPQMQGSVSIGSTEISADQNEPAPTPQGTLKSGEAPDGRSRDQDSAGQTLAEVTPMIEDAIPAPAPAPSIVAEAEQGIALSAIAPSAEAPRLQTRIAAPSDGFYTSDQPYLPPVADTETFANETPNPLKITTEEPVSTFSIDVDTAAYSVIRSSLMRGMLPPEDAVRIEEMVNYFPYAYPGPDGAHPFHPTVTVTPTPWNPGTQLVHIAIQGELPALEDRPPLNLVFLIDTSGSMEAANKLPLLKQSFRLMLGELRPQDQVSIVAYAGSAGQVLAPTNASERATILEALNRLDAGGGTAGQAGLQQAYSVAKAMTEDGEVSRIILATDGDFNVGIHDPEALKDYIADKRDTGVYLSVLGFGRGNLDDTTMQALAQNGNGTASYIDTLSEAQKVLVDQLSGALFPIADDMKIQVEFNPDQIAEYRLIGYETRALAREDFNNDSVDAGEIGAGHSVTAIYEITPVGSDAVMSDALRYQAAPEPGNSDELGFLKLRYKTPGEDVSTLIEVAIVPGMGTPNGDTHFATAIAGFGQLLSGDKYLGNWGFADAIALASTNKGEDAFGYRAEAVTLMRLAQTLSEN